VTGGILFELVEGEAPADGAAAALKRPAKGTPGPGRRTTKAPPRRDRTERATPKQGPGRRHRKSRRPR
jgi:hypothetical protein